MDMASAAAVASSRRDAFDNAIPTNHIDPVRSDNKVSYQ